MGTSKKTTKQKLREGIKREFYRLQRILPGQPKSEDMLKEGMYTFYDIKLAYGGWYPFMRSIGEMNIRGPRFAINKKELIAEYKRCEEKLGAQPTYEEFVKMSKIPVSRFTKTYGNWTKFLKAIKREPHPSWYSQKLTHEEMHADYDRVKRKLRRVPNSREFTEMSKYAMASYRNYFTSYDEYLKLRGDYIPPITPETTTTKQLIENYKQVKAKIRRTPTLDDIKAHSKYGSNEYYQRFKGYLNFLVKAGEKSPKQQAIDDIRRVKKLLGRTPTVVEYAEHGTIIPTTAYSKFGSWNNFLKAAKLPVNRTMRPRKK